MILGTAISQIAIAASIPIITRLYSVSELGTSAVLVSLFSTLSIIGCFRYEIAIPLPKATDHAIALVRAAVVICTIFALVLACFQGMFIIFYRPRFADIDIFGLFIAVGYFHATSLMSIGNMTAIRSERYSTISRARILVLILQVPLQLILGLIGANTIGLLVGYATANYGASLYMLLKWRNANRTRVPSALTRHVLADYRGYPLHTSWAAILNTVSLEAPLLYFGIRYSTSRAGYVGMVQTIVAVPLSLVTSSVGLAIYGEWGKGRILTGDHVLTLRAQTKWLLLRTAALSICYVAVAAIATRVLATPVLGQDWAALWQYVIAIGPFYGAIAIANPTGWLLELFGETRLTLTRSASRIVSLAGTILILEVLRPSTLDAARILSVYGIIAAGLFILFSIRPLIHPRHTDLEER
jgi:O-antigen/teichoic acid export membrane protein